MESFVISSSMLIPSAIHSEITPAMLAVLWGIADEIDRKRLPDNQIEPVWLEIPSKQLRDPEGRNDNFWLRECLQRLTGLKLAGEYRGNPWGTVILAEWHIKEGGSITKLLIPPAAIQAIRTPKTFAKIEITAAYRLKGHARRLYAALADKKRMGNPFWVYELEEIYEIFDTGGKYKKWYDLRRYVLEPALKEINDYGTVAVKMTPQKLGRSVVKVRFDWRWKTIDEARSTEEENERPAIAHHQDKAKQDAPPLIPDQTQEIKDVPEPTEEENRPHQERLAETRAELHGNPLPQKRKLTDEERQKGRSRLAEMKALLR